MWPRHTQDKTFMTQLQYFLHTYLTEAWRNTSNFLLKPSAYVRSVKYDVHLLVRGRWAEDLKLIPLRLKQPTTAVSYTSIFPASHLQVCLFVFITSWKDQAQVRLIDRQSSQSLNLLASAKDRPIKKLEVESVPISTKRYLMSCMQSRISHSSF